MTYHSLFDKIAEPDPSFSQGFKQQEYSGTLDTLLDETRKALTSRSESELIRLALHPPRIIRAYVDYKIQNPHASEVEELLRYATQVGLDIYSGQEQAAQNLEDLRNRTIRSGNKTILRKKVKQPFDAVTWKATNPERSKRTSRDLLAKTGGEPIIFIALAHGGVAAGMDTYLRYCDESGKEGSAFYVARFSTQKLKDVYPQLSPSEVTYLQQQLLGRKPIIFDEDRASGKTLEEAKKFFEGTVFPQERVIVVTNLDAQAELIQWGFGGKLKELYKETSNIEYHKSISELYTKEVIEKNFNYLTEIRRSDNFEENYLAKKKPYLDNFPKISHGESKIEF